MSRLTGADALGLFEAYQAVYAPQELTEEQVWEEVETWVNDLIEEGYDLSDYTWEEMYESYLEEKEGIFNNDITRGIGNYARSLFSNPQNKTAANSGQFGRYGAPSAQVKTPTAKPAAPARPIATSPAAPRPAAGAPARPAATAAPKPAAATTPASKPTSTASAQTGDKAKDMDTWAKANPKLAAASAERDRTRGTSATTNPLMKDMKSRLPAPKTPSPTTSSTTSSTAFSKSTPSLGSSTPEVKSAGTSSGSAGFGKSAPSIGSSAFKPSPASAAPTPTPTTAAATTPAAKPALKKPIVSGFDMFDVVKGYLIGEGYADTEEAALAIMINMSEEWKQSIIKSI